MKINITIKQCTAQNLLLIACCILTSLAGYGQVSSSVDSTAIKIGAELFYKIQVKADTTAAVVFSEGQTFLPLEMINSYPIDTTKKEGYYQLTKTYGLTQFDSGTYTIPKQKITIGDNVTIGAGAIITKSVPSNSIVYNKVETIIKNKDSVS